MSDVLLQVLAEVRALRQQLEEQKSLPQVLKMKRAAFELSVSLTTLKGMIRDGEILTVMIRGRRMVPASEVRRLATPEAKAERKAARAKSALQDPNALR